MKNIIYIMLCFPVFLFSQEKLTGTILEANDNNTPMGLAGANVYWLNTSIGAVTDIMVNLVCHTKRVIKNW